MKFQASRNSFFSKKELNFNLYNHKSSLLRILSLGFLRILLYDCSSDKHFFQINALQAYYRALFDRLDTNKSGSLYTYEAVSAMRKFDNEMPFNLNWRQVDSYIKVMMTIFSIIDDLFILINYLLCY